MTITLKMPYGSSIRKRTREIENMFEKCKHFRKFDILCIESEISTNNSKNLNFLT